MFIRSYADSQGKEELRLVVDRKFPERKKILELATAILENIESGKKENRAIGNGCFFEVKMNKEILGLSGVHIFCTGFPPVLFLCAALFAACGFFR